MNTLPKLNPSTTAQSTCLKLKRTSRTALKTAALSLAAEVVMCGGAGDAWGRVNYVLDN